MGEAARRRRYRERHRQRWSFHWACPHCDSRDATFLVEEMPDQDPTARCAQCTYLMEVGPQHRMGAEYG